MNQRWQLVLGCLGASEAPFSQGALVKFRERMIAHNIKGTRKNTLDLRRVAVVTNLQRIARLPKAA